jgi:hypothetical protein
MFAKQTRSSKPLAVYVGFPGSFEGLGELFQKFPKRILLAPKMVKIATFSMQFACFFAKKCAKMGLLILYFIFRITVEIRTRF